MRVWDRRGVKATFDGVVRRGQQRRGVEAMNGPMDHSNWIAAAVSLSCGTQALARLTLYI